MPTEILGKIIRTNKIIPIPPNHWVKDRQNISIEWCSREGKLVNTDAPVFVIPDTDSKKELKIILF